MRLIYIKACVTTIVTMYAVLHREKICISFTVYEKKYPQLGKSYLSQRTDSLL